MHIAELIPEMPLILPLPLLFADRNSASAVYLNYIKE
jgi:hypothetical protein